MNNEMREKVNKVVEEFKAHLRKNLEHHIGKPLDVERIKVSLSEQLEAVLSADNRLLPDKHIIALGNLFSIAWWPPEERRKVNPKDLVRAVPTELLEELFRKTIDYGCSGMFRVIALEVQFRRGEISDWEWKWHENGVDAEIVFTLNKPINFIQTTFEIKSDRTG